MVLLIRMCFLLTSSNSTWLLLMCLRTRCTIVQYSFCSLLPVSFFNFWQFVSSSLHFYIVQAQRFVGETVSRGVRLEKTLKSQGFIVSKLFQFLFRLFFLHVYRLSHAPTNSFRSTSSLCFWICSKVSFWMHSSSFNLGITYLIKWQLWDKSYYGFVCIINPR